MKKFRIGERLDKFPGGTWNKLVDRYLQEEKTRNQQLPPGTVYTKTGAILTRVYNSTATLFYQGEVMGLNDFVEDPNQDTDFDANNSPTYLAVDPNIPAHFHRHAIAIEPIDSETVGWACIGGSIHAKVNVTDSAHPCAAIKPGSRILQSSPTGDFFTQNTSDLGEQLIAIAVNSYEMEAICRITSNIPDGSGYYPCVVEVWSGGTFVRIGNGKVLDLDA